MQIIARIVGVLSQCSCDRSSSTRTAGECEKFAEMRHRSYHINRINVSSPDVVTFAKRTADGAALNPTTLR
ncbi:hypothetical protein Aduo_014302 [Ancylostoma duodenale]